MTDPTNQHIYDEIKSEQGETKKLDTKVSDFTRIGLTTSHFDTTIQKLQTDLGKSKEEKQDIMGALKEISGLKDVFAAAESKDGSLVKIISTAKAVLGLLSIKIVNWEKLTKNSIKKLVSFRAGKKSWRKGRELGENDWGLPTLKKPDENPELKSLNATVTGLSRRISTLNKNMNKANKTLALLNRELAG